MNSTETDKAKQKRAAALRSVIDELRSQSVGGRPPSKENGQSKRISPHQFIERRMQEIDSENNAHTKGKADKINKEDKTK